MAMMVIASLYIVHFPLKREDTKGGNQLHLFISEYGRFLGKKSERLVVSEKGKTVMEVPFRDLKEVTVASMGVSMSTDAIAGCIEFGVPVHFLNSSGKPYALVTSPTLNATVATRREQLKAYDDERGLHLAKAFVTGKINNQANLVKYFAKHRKGQESYSDLMAQARVIEELKNQVDSVEGSTVNDARPYLMNLEGRAAAIYWKAVGNIAVGEEFEGREHRGAQDPFNTCLNYGYGILYNQVWGAVLLAGLEPFGGFLHVDRPGKPSLVLDMVEEFRPPTVDRGIIAMLVRGWRPKFDEEGKLSQESRREVADAVLTRLEGRERYQGEKRKLSSVIVTQARRLATCVRGEGKYRPFTATW